MTSIRKIFPEPVRRSGRQVALGAGRLTAKLRVEPSFLMVGAQRAGTTSLFRALMAHPNVMRPVMHKGVNYFDVNSEKDWSWYLGHFPLRVSAQRKAAADQETAAVFEASGYYMFHPHAPRRIAEALPSIKIVAMVRDPVERAYSAYKHELARGFETESFEHALELEEQRVAPELKRMIDDPSYQSGTYRHQAYRLRGHYAEQLAAFSALLGGDRIHVVESERFFTQPEDEFTRLLQFLDLPVVMPPSFDRFNARPGSPLSPELEAELRAHFAPHNAALATFLGKPLTWPT
jgi:hypothetical protein